MQHTWSLLGIVNSRVRTVAPGLIFSVAMTLAPISVMAQRSAGGHVGGHAGTKAHAGRSNLAPGTRVSVARPRSAYDPASYWRGFVPMTRSAPAPFRTNQNRAEDFFSFSARRRGPRNRARFRFRPGELGPGILGWWEWLWYPDCQWDADGYWDSPCGSSSELPPGDAPEEASNEANDQPAVMFFLKDGSVHAASDYWAADGLLHLGTAYGGEQTFPMEQIDVRRTATENAARGIYFSLKPYPDSFELLQLTDARDQVCPMLPEQPAGSLHPQPADAHSASAFGASGSRTEQGFAVDAVLSGSFAARLGIEPGDVLLEVDCAPVHTEAEIASAMAANPASSVWASYLIKGAWLSEKRIRR